MTARTLEYYSRQVILPEIGPEGQARLQKSRVLVVGAGGLGSPILMALAGAGVGRLTIVDHDTVAASNLNRQFLYTPENIGQSKAQIARERLLAYHPDLEIEAGSYLFTNELAKEIIPGHDLVIAAVDNRETRRLINQICFQMGKTWIDGGVNGFSGAVAVYVPGMTACFDCRYGLGDENEDSKKKQDVEEKIKAPIGALGVTASVIGSLEADLALCLLLGLPDPLQGQILYYHGRTMDFQKISIEARPECPICGNNLR